MTYNKLLPRRLTGGASHSPGTSGEMGVPYGEALVVIQLKVRIISSIFNHLLVAKWYGIEKIHPTLRTSYVGPPHPSGGPPRYVLRCV